MLVTVLLSLAHDGAAESVLVVAHQGAAAHCQGAAVDRSGDIADRVGAAEFCQGATVNYSSVIINHLGVAGAR
jgi:hypothetical protein